MTQPALSEILAIFDKSELTEVVTVLQLEDEYTDFCGQPVEVGDSTPAARLKRYARSITKPFLAAVNITYLQELVKGLQKEIAALPTIDYSSFTLSKDLPTYEEVQGALQQIHAEVTRVSSYREKCNHYTTVLKTAFDHVSGFRKALQAFLHDETNEPFAWEGLAQRKRATEAWILDVEAHEQRLIALRAIVTQLHDDILGQRLNLLMRSDSAVRLLVQKVDPIDQRGNALGSRHRTTPGRAPVDIGDAEVVGPSDMAQS